MVTLDAKGLACPKPVLMAKKQLEAGEEFSIMVDNPTAVENLRRFAASQGAAIAVSGGGNEFTAVITPGTAPASAAAGEEFVCQTAPAGSYAVFLGHDTVGDGEHELGQTLASMLLYTLTEEDVPPARLLLMNSGVRLACSEDTAKHIQTLVSKGCEVLVCGTCLKFYGLDGSLLAGRVSNMYEIFSAMRDSQKVITL